MQNFAPKQDLTKLGRKQKGLTKEFGGIAAPYYWTDVVMPEGTPLKFHATVAEKVVPPVTGEGAKVIGLSLQEVYDDAAWGQLKGYHRANDTAARVGDPIGVLTGTGYAQTNCYVGAVTPGAPAFLDFSGSTPKLTATSSTNNAVPIVFEGSGTDGKSMVRIRFNFDLA